MTENNTYFASPGLSCFKQKGKAVEAPAKQQGNAELMLQIKTLLDM